MVINVTSILSFTQGILTIGTVVFFNCLGCLHKKMKSGHVSNVIQLKDIFSGCDPHNSARTTHLCRFRWPKSNLELLERFGPPICGVVFPFGFCGSIFVTHNSIHKLHHTVLRSWIGLEGGGDSNAKKNLPKTVSKPQKRHPFVATFSLQTFVCQNPLNFSKLTLNYGNSKGEND
jgi:hypothetical protein